MNTEQIMAQYNQYERISLNVPGYTRMESGRVIRYVADEEWGSFISYSQLEVSELDDAIAGELAYFQSVGKNFEWKVYGTDKPQEITDKLVQHGFEPGEPESFMVLELDSIDGFLEERGRCVEVTDEAGILDYISVSEKVWGGDHSGQRAHLIACKKSAPHNTSIYVIYDDQGIAVSSARIEYNLGSPFAGIWGGSTLREHRGQGHYSELLHKRVNDAKRRGIKYLVIDASDMSRPIVEKYGFRFVTTTTPYEYMIDKPAS